MDKIIKKWSPILDVLGIDEKNRELVSQYAEDVMQTESTIDPHSRTNALPMSLKVLSKLNFDEIDIKLVGPEDVNTFNIKVYFSNDEYPIATLEHYHSLLMGELLDILKDKKEISIYRLIDTLCVKEDEKGNFFHLTSRIKIK